MPDSYDGTPSADSYYERLGVDPDASDETITRASKLAKRTLHPDNNSSEQATAEREFDRVTDAADALTDSESRAAYDTFLDDQGPATGTDRYEAWDSAGRPKPPTAWLSEPRSGGSTTSPTTASTTRESTPDRSAADTPDGSTADGSARTQQTADQTPRRRPGAQPRGSTATPESGEPTAGDATDSAAATQTTGASSTPPPGGSTQKRAPESVLSEDPEDLYSKYVLDSEAAWGTPEMDAEATGDGASASAATAVLSRIVSPTAAAGITRFVAAPKPWWLHAGVALVVLALAVAVGPLAERLVLLPFVALPRLGLWLYPVLAAAVTVAPGVVPFDTPALWLIVYAGLTGGATALGRRLRSTGPS